MQTVLLADRLFDGTGAEPIEQAILVVEHGRSDLVAHGRNFATASSQAGGVIEIILYPGVGHGFGREPGLNTDRALALIKSFIARRLAEGLSARRDASPVCGG